MRLRSPLMAFLYCTCKAVHEIIRDARTRRATLAPQLRPQCRTHPPTKGAAAEVGKLHLVDLAGAESAARSGVLGERLDEAKNINKSARAWAAPSLRGLGVPRW